MLGENLFFRMRHWQRLPSVTVGAPYLEAFKAKLDWALGSLATLLIAGALELDGF